MQEFEERDTAIVGVSTNSIASHARFAANQELEYPLLADTDGEIAKSYGVLRRIGKMAQRATFLIDRKGIIRRVWPKVEITGHAGAVLAAIDELGLA